MSKIKTALNLLRTPSKMILPLSNTGIFNWMNDEDYLKFVFRYTMGYELNLTNPRSFSEKMQWLKLNDRQKRYIELVDKVKVKRHISKVLGDEYVIPELGVWDSFDEIKFEALPDRFVLKCNHDSGSIVVCSDMKKFNMEKTRKKLTDRLHQNAFNYGREWPYKYVKRKVFAEEYISDKGKELTDYKFYCFNGNPKFCQVILNRSSKETIDFFDMHWEHQPFVGITPNIQNSKSIIEKPKNFDKMKNFARELSTGTYFCRIDFYEADDHLYFGEFTLYPGSGFGYFAPDKWNYILGDMISI